MLKVKPADWTDAERMAVLSDEDLFKVIQSGGESVELSKLMPAFHSKLGDEEIAQLVTFIKSLHGEAKK
jgi:mono/diheme cytochrome c family protein